MKTKLVTVLTVFAVMFIPAAPVSAISLSQLVELFISLDIISEDKVVNARAAVRDLEGGGTTATVTATPIATTPVASVSTTQAECPSLTRNLWLGASGADVSRLQVFLRSTGDFTYPEITGYYGSATAAAIKRWQARNDVVSSGTAETTGYGVVGPRTRSMLLQRCSPPGIAGTNERLLAFPTRGNAPLSVQFTAKPVGFDPLITFGDGDSTAVTCLSYAPDTDRCLGFITPVHQYTEPGTYEAQLKGLDGTVQGSVTITVFAGGDAPTTLGGLSASPLSGSAPLTVSFTSTYGDASSYRPSYADGQDTMLSFGDGLASTWLQCPGAQAGASANTCATPITTRHTFQEPGVYTVRVIRQGGYCIDVCPSETLGTLTIRVTE